MKRRLKYLTVGLIGLLTACFFGIGWYLLGIPADYRDKRVVFDIKTLDQAVTQYYLSHNRFPATLGELAKENCALIPKRTLIDPWGNSYVYDPTVLDPKTGRPVISSISALGKAK